MKLRLILLAAVVVAVVFGVFRYVDKKDSESNQPQASTSAQSENNESKYPIIDLQPIVDAWAANNPPSANSGGGGGKTSVVIYDLANRKSVAVLNPDEQYFTASIYKLYVAYAGYQKIADGTYSFDDSYLSGYTRGKCLDAMIRDSYSPCGEKMWAELGKEKLTNQLKDYGLTNTSMTGLQTSARDAAIVLQRLFERKELSEAHTNLFLDSMKTQDAKYRRGLPSGFVKSTVYNKVGWNEQVEWHDTAIVTLANGRSYVITVFTEKVGYSNVAALGKAIETKLTE